MSNNVLVRRIRPYLFTSFRRYNAPSIPQRLISTATAPKPPHETQQEERKVTHDYERRVSQLQFITPPEQWYPRLQRGQNSRTTLQDYRRKYGHVEEGKTEETTTTAVTGRILSIRAAGSKLLFISIQQDGYSLQGVVNLGQLGRNSNIESGQAKSSLHESFRNFAAAARRGDVYAFQGHPHRTQRGELSILCTELPELLAPSLHQIPDTLDPETRAKKRHVDMLVNPQAIQTLKVRHAVEKSLISFLDSDGFTSVHTPILTSSAGGAIARPFETEATEFAGETLALRIAPELWLKRLIVGGMEKVYEFGPSFRNEGVDATHNPEFYTCEFYEAYATLPDLMAKTEKMLLKISEDVRAGFPAASRDLATPSTQPELTTPIQKLPFLPTLQKTLNHPLPDLSTPSAPEDLKRLFTTLHLSLPSNPTLPRLLDTLASTYLEPLSQKEPIFITHQPAILSPLAKHFTCPSTGQQVSARAELFINGWEIANMYEEENSPFEQRRKFLEQAQQASGVNEVSQASVASAAGQARQGRKEGGSAGEAMEVDEAYLEALEWGLPPTGGWGCGVDRLVMLFAGRERIGDVLAFGGLRNVVGVGRRRTRD